MIHSVLFLHLLSQQGVKVEGLGFSDARSTVEQ
jgi:hypothetical protein